MAGNNSFMTSLLALLDDNKFMKDVKGKPCSGTEQVDVNHYLSIIEKILNTVAENLILTGSWDIGFQGNRGQSTSLNLPTPVPLSSTINELCCQITCEALHTNNVHQTMASLFDKLSSFSWDAKAVLTLLAFSLYYAENCHLAQFEESDNLLRLTAMLRGSRAIGNSSNIHRINAFVKLNDLINETLEFTKFIVELVKPFSASIDELACFKYIVVTVLGCSVQFSGMINAGNEFREQDLLTFSNQVTKKYACFREQYLYKEIERRFKYCNDIVELMEVLVCTKDDSSQICKYSNGKATTVNVEELRNKSVMLLISNLNLSNDDLGYLTNIYSVETFRSSNYEIMWAPIVEVHDDAMQKQFEKKRSQMKWYACNSLVSKAAAEFIQKTWQFRQQTMVVLLDQKGKVVNKDAMPMLRLWGWEAFPFTEAKGKELWNTQGINWLELVFPNVKQSGQIHRQKLIFFYGSAEDSEIVKKIKKYLNEIASNPASAKFHNINDQSEQFLIRLESCMSLKMKASSDVFDSRTEELLKLYTIYKRHGGFGILARGSRVFVNTGVMDFEKVLSEHSKWIGKITETKAFESVFKEYYEEVVTKSPCHRFSIPNMVGNIPECIKCTCCTNYMKASVTFECCHGAH